VEALTPAKHAQLVAKDRDLDLAGGIIVIARSQQSQKRPNGEVERRQKHRDSR
jgi:hypothetical protein